MDEESIVNNAMAKSSLEDGANETSGATSALEENILSKGKNAYYYAHASNLGKGGDKKNLGGAPRLLARTESKQGEAKKNNRPGFWNCSTDSLQSFSSAPQNTCIYSFYEIWYRHIDLVTALNLCEYVQEHHQ